MSTPALPTVEDLRTVISTALTDVQLEALIGDVALMVAECVAPLDAERQAAIIKYAAADLIAGTVTNAGGGTLTSQRLGDAAETYATPTTSQQFGGSSYWRTALMLDPNGCLQALGRRRAFIQKV